MRIAMLYIYGYDTDVIRISSILKSLGPNTFSLFCNFSSVLIYTNMYAARMQNEDIARSFSLDL